MAPTWRNLMNAQRLDVAWSHAPADVLRGAFARRAVAFNVVIASMATLFFCATFRAGIDRGMDQLIAWNGSGRVLNAIATVLTQERLHLGGYALSECIYQELENRGLTPNPEIAGRLGLTVPENLRAIYVDKILSDIKRDLQTPPNFCGDAIRGVGADDLGYVDLVKISFALFGPHVSSFYYLFFLIYGLTLFCALLERHKDRVAQTVLIAVAGLIYVSCYYSDFLLLQEPSGSANMLNVRFIPVLAMIPGSHLLLILTDKAKLNSWRFSIVLFQSLMILFVIHIRASASWWIFVFVLSAVVLGATHLKAPEEHDGWMRIASRSVAAQWPAFTPVLIIFVGVNAIALSLHPIYRQGGWLPQHAIWHSIYYSLQSNPKYLEKYDAYHDGQTGDAMPLAGAMVYLKHHPEEDNPDLYLAGKALKYAAMERLVRLALFDFIRRDPWFMFETFFIVKPKLIINAIIHETTLEWHHADWRGRLLFMLAIVLIGGTAAGSSIDRQRLSRFVGVFTMGALGSLLVPLLTVTNAQVISDEIIAMQISTALLMSLAFAYAARASAQFYLRKPNQPAINPA
jgi:hypothetical protein